MDLKEAIKIVEAYDALVEHAILCLFTGNYIDHSEFAKLRITTMGTSIEWPDVYEESLDTNVTWVDQNLFSKSHEEVLSILEERQRVRDEAEIKRWQLIHAKDEANERNLYERLKAKYGDQIGKD